MIRVGIVGVTGYGGRELLRLLGAHPGVELVKAASTSAAGTPLNEVLPAFTKVTDIVLEAFDAEVLAQSCDVVFLGVPGTESMPLVRELRASGARVIDMGPDFRLKDLDAFKTYYKKEHTVPELIDERVYGLVPWYREELKQAELVAVPGCYPISHLIALKPVVPEARPEAPIVINSVSGISGAGRGLAQHFHFPEMNENVWAYKLGRHQHTPEVEQELDHVAQVQFNPHVGPYTRGILSTITLHPAKPVDVAACYARYQEEPFVRVLGESAIPDVTRVRATNFCDVGWVEDARTGNLIIVSAVDNLTGGTAGMAIQCMNLMFGIDETTGLHYGGMSV